MAFFPLAVCQGLDAVSEPLLLLLLLDKSIPIILAVAGVATGLQSNAEEEGVLEAEDWLCHLHRLFNLLWQAGCLSAAPR